MKQVTYIAILAFFLLCSDVFSQGTWQQKANFGGGTRWYGCGFSIGSKGYIGTGWKGYLTNNMNDFWEYDRMTDVWTQKSNFPGTARNQAVGFSIGTKGYIGTGTDVSWNCYNDFWEWDQAINTWTQKANVPGLPRSYAVGFSIGSKGYIGGGADVTGTILTDFWEWDQIANAWTQKANMPGIKKISSVGFSIANKGYIGTGMDSTQNIFFDDFWEWDQITNNWTQKANFPGGKRWGAYGYSIGNYGYVGMGDSLNPFQPVQSSINDLWRYFPFSNAWVQVASFPAGSRSGPVGFSIGCTGFFGTGADTSHKVINDFWEYLPDTLTAVVAGQSTICAGDSTSLYAFGGINFSWNTGQSAQFINVKPTVTTTYSVSVSDMCGTDITSITITVIPYPVISVTYNVNLCGTRAVQFTDSSSNGSTWYWDFGDGDTSNQQNPSHYYASTGQHAVTLTVSPSPFGCNSTAQLTVDVPPFSELYIPNAFSPNDDGNNDTYFISGSCIDEMHLSIFNRWGEKVFETLDQKTVWDGMYKGEKQNAGVYMYSFKGTLSTGEVIDKKGNITLMR